MKKKGSKKKYVWALMLVMVCAGSAEAATVNLAVDPNIEADWVSDNFYRAPGTCAIPGAFAKVGTALKGATVAFNDTVSADGVYCYAATAVDTAGNESVQSNKLGVTVNVNPPVAPGNLHQVGPVTP